MSARHTPGPWAWIGKKLVAGKNQTHLLEMIEAPGMGRAAEPNRALIAAAPDMLAACETALEMLVDSWGADQIAVGDDQVATVLKRAIAKAKGIAA